MYVSGAEEAARVVEVGRDEPVFVIGDAVVTCLDVAVKQTEQSESERERDGDGNEPNGTNETDETNETDGKNGTNRTDEANGTN